jgi:hypothetical protein
MTTQMVLENGMVKYQNAKMLMSALPVLARMEQHAMME